MTANDGQNLHNVFFRYTGGKWKDFRNSCIYDWYIFSVIIVNIWTSSISPKYHGLSPKRQLRHRVKNILSLYCLSFSRRKEPLKLAGRSKNIMLLYILQKHLGISYLELGVYQGYFTVDFHHSLFFLFFFSQHKDTFIALALFLGSFRKERQPHSNYIMIFCMEVLYQFPIWKKRAKITVAIRHLYQNATYHLKTSQWLERRDKFI